MTTRRPRTTYPKRQKLAAVMAAELGGVTVAAKETGIDHQRISDWMADPKYGDIRRKTREDLAEEVKVVAHLAWKRVAETMPTMEPRDAMFAAEKASTILQLLSGQATGRTEHRDITGGMEDHEWDALTAMLQEAAHAGD